MKLVIWGFFFFMVYVLLDKLSRFDACVSVVAWIREHQVSCDV